jgi:hypothetical protein
MYRWLASLDAAKMDDRPLTDAYAATIGSWSNGSSKRSTWGNPSGLRRPCLTTR